jgi:predicted esterase
MRPAALLLLALLACGKDEGDAATDDTAGGGGDGEPDGPVLADLATPSGPCPDLSTPGTSTFLSGGIERTVTVALPDPLPANAPVIFFWHGLSNSGGSRGPGELTASSLGVDDLAQELGAIFVLPDSRVMEIYSFSFYMWEVFGQDELDLILFDDLRSCLVTEVGADPARMASMGFSGGALFETVLLGARADTLSAVVEFSGGANVENAALPGPLSTYGTPAWEIPVLLTSGGESDAWPNPSLTLVDFTAATDSLQAALVADQSFVVRCLHSRGHTITNDLFTFGLDWAMAGQFGEPSPYEAQGIGAMEGDCTVVAAE